MLLAETLLVASALAVCLLYLTAAARLRRRGDSWPWLRDAAFAAGTAAVVAAVALPMPGGEFTGHMAGHLLLGMYAPLLLVLARPVTLALRALPPGRARRTLLAAVRSRPAAALVWPPVAALLDVGGLWLLYRTPLFERTHESMPLHMLVHLHVLAAGLLFTLAICQVEPLRHRSSLPLRAGTLVAAGAAHAVLARSLYAAPPPGTDFGPADLHRGAELMYYGGDAAEIALALVLALGWYAAEGRALRRERRRTRSTGADFVL
ncbi:cytochrome c oxidase assembly protein [Actinomadura parmotrematis]|uniref:Cytochrome c oxidase assembly protein n=1 Tax=Actinomadura parmotrematis TaxID=2864039 RepID=A0ABS7FVC4_9ACTN|nr:cytochrome c oxidase assembly protein [Actinomadura parmotrematis]MBW8484135.1 cytochrome c oxidase assembly protein [Actinomadura parmotrematis]